jgi:large subunit ribosomal protein L25
MMDRIELDAKSRTVKKRSAKHLRGEGQVPGIIYGSGLENIPLRFESLPLKRTLAQAGASQLIHLRIDDSAQTQPVLAREIQRDVFTGDPTHVDFLAVSMTERITAEVTINLVGEASDASAGSGVLLQGANTIEIECLPGDLIPFLEVDISDLELNSAIFVSDLNVPPDVTILSDPQEMIAQIIPERLEEEEEEEEEFFAEEEAEVEVIGRVRDEDEEETEDD